MGLCWGGLIGDRHCGRDGRRAGHPGGRAECCAQPEGGIRGGDLPLINQDLEANLPESVVSLHKSIESADAVLLATPEFNRSYSPVLKNALDWGSRPQGENKWNKKPALVIGASPHALGAFGAQHHLRQVLVYINMYPLQQPEFYLSKAAEKFNDAGELTDANTKKLIEKLWDTFVPWINAVKAGR